MGVRASFRGSFNPASLGVVGAWFRVAKATNAGSGLAFTLPDVLSSNHATTTTDARKPTISASANGLPILVCSASGLLAPLSAAVNSATKFWVAFHIRPTVGTGNPVPISIDSAGGGGANARKILIQRDSGDRIQVHLSTGPVARNGIPGTIWTLNTWRHIIYELNLDSGAAEEDRCVIRQDATAQSLTFTDAVGTPGAMPTSMNTPTGSMNLFAQNAATGGNGLVGEIGPNILVGVSAMSGARCCLTEAAAAALSAFERPTS